MFTPNDATVIFGLIHTFFVGAFVYIFWRSRRGH